MSRLPCRTEKHGLATDASGDHYREVVSGASLVCNHLERQPRLDLLLQDLGDSFIEMRKDLHGQLRIDAMLGNQVIESVCQGSPDTTKIALMSVYIIGKWVAKAE